MELRELLRLQEEFDKQHSGRIDFFARITDQRVEVLEHLIVCVAGEVGELANLAKKAARGDFLLSSRKDAVAGELADIFAYLLKLANQLDIDLEVAYLRKLDDNRRRFATYAQDVDDER
jgi:NTP pyrophosphatase (non-canonical NTP hydrolase)